MSSFDQSYKFWRKIYNRLRKLVYYEIPLCKRDRVLHSPIHSFEYCHEYLRLKTRIFQPSLTLTQYLDQVNLFEIFMSQNPKRPPCYNGSLFWRNCGFVDAFIGYSSTNAQSLTTHRISTSDNYYNDPKNVPIFQEYVICSSDFMVKTGINEDSQEPIYTNIKIHKLIGVDTKDCIQKIEDNLKAQTGSSVYNTHEVLNFETFQKNKFVLSLSTDQGNIFEALESIKNFPPNVHKEYRTTISFCHFVDKDGRDFCLTLIKDLNADLRGVLWERCINTIKNASLDNWRTQLKSRARIHFLPNGSFISNNDVETTLDGHNSAPPTYEEAIKCRMVVS